MINHLSFKGQYDIGNLTHTLHTGHITWKQFLNITVNFIKCCLKFVLYYRSTLLLVHATVAQLKEKLEENFSLGKLKMMTKKDLILDINLYWDQRTCSLFGEYSWGFKIQSIQCIVRHLKSILQKKDKKYIQNEAHLGN